MRRRSALLAVLLSSFTMATAAQTPKHFFWSVKDAKGSEAFLVGSLHVLTKDFYPLSPELEKAPGFFWFKIILKPGPDCFPFVTPLLIP